MFGLGAMEIGLILVVALIVIGPKKLPELAGQLARTVRDLQRTATEFSRELTNPVNEIRRDVAKPVDALKREVTDSISETSADPYQELAADAAEDSDADTSYANIHTEEQDFIVEEVNSEPDEANHEPSTEENHTFEQTESLPTVRPAPQAVAYQAEEEPTIADDQLSSNGTEGTLDASNINDAEDMV
jgi:TatA/E family protein of Tat protein translocase